MKFSIITPSFKQLDWLRLCIASVRDQGAPGLHVEHIVQDGGTPGIEEFAREVGADFYSDGDLVRQSPMSSSDYSLVIHSESDQGMYDAINRGLRRSSGEICAWLNCDEQYLPETLTHVADFFSTREESDLVIGDTILLDVGLTPRSYRKALPPNRRYIQLFQMNLHSSSLFFRRTLLERGHWLGTRFRSIGDAEWVAGLLDKGERFDCIPEPLSTFVLAGDNLSGNALSKSESARWRAEMKASLWEKARLKVGNLMARLLAGAYLPRYRSVAIFLSGQISKRTRLPARWLDFRFKV